MFPYSDPTNSGALQRLGALEIYREILDRQYQRLGTLPGSGFTAHEAFSELRSGAASRIDIVRWGSFPKSATTTDEKIDQDRLRWQDEYVEWRTEIDASGKVIRVTFTTEFPEYFQALAAVSVDALKEEIAILIPGADPSDRELFGPEFSPNNATPLSRSNRFRQNLSANPWNNGERGILCLTQQFNTLGALFSLLGHCGIERADVAPGDVCANVGGFCGPGRSSDPNVCLAAQNLVRARRSFSAADPAGIHIERMEGGWKLGGAPFDINDSGANQGIWTMSRGGHRGVLEVRDSLTLNNDPISTGAQVSTALVVGSSVISAADADLPEWSRIGREMTRVIA